MRRGGTGGEECIAGVYRCFGEGAMGGDYVGPDIITVGGGPDLREEIGTVSLVAESTQGLISVNITAPNPDLPGGMFHEFEICYPDPLNEGLSRKKKKSLRYSCVTTIRNDETMPTVMIDMVFKSCSEWTKIVRNFGASTGTPGVFWVNCLKDE